MKKIPAFGKPMQVEGHSAACKGKFTLVTYQRSFVTVQSQTAVRQDASQKSNRLANARFDYKRSETSNSFESCGLRASARA